MTAEWRRASIKKQNYQRYWVLFVLAKHSISLPALLRSPAAG